MKRSALLLVATAPLFLLLVGTVPVRVATPTKGKAKDSSTESIPVPSAAELKPQENADRARHSVDRLLPRTSREVGKILRNQSRLSVRLENIETAAWMALGLLAVPWLLSAGALLLAWRQHGALRSLEQRMGELRDRADGRRREGAGDAAEAALGAKPPLSSADRTAGDGRPPAPRQPAPARVQPRPPEGVAPLPPQAPVVPGSALTEPPFPLERHREIASLLFHLRREAPRLAGSFANPALREQLLAELDAPLGARLERLQTIADQGEEQLRERWVGPDLVPTLDALVRFYSEAVEEERRGHVPGLAGELRKWLYEAFGPACSKEGWFAIDPVEPYVTEFDPRVHHAVAGRDVDGAEGRIIAIKAIGRRDPRSNAVTAKAEVIVGR